MQENDRELIAVLTRIADGIESIVAYINPPQEELTPEEICWNCGESFIPIAFAATCGNCTFPEAEAIAEIETEDIPF